MRSLTSCEAGVVGVEHLARVGGVEALLGALAPRHGDQPVEVVADHLRLARLLAHALEAAQLALGLLAHLVGHAGLVDLAAVLVDDRAVVLAQLLADRLHLLAQEVLALLLAAAPDSTSSRMRRRTCSSARRSRCSARASSRRSVTSSVSSSSTFCVEAQVGRVAGGVGQRAGLGDRAQELRRRGHRRRAARGSPRDGAVLALELRVRPSTGTSSGDSVDLDAQPAAGVGVRRAGDAARRRPRAGRRAPRRADARARRRGRSSRPTRSCRRDGGRGAPAPRRRRPRAGSRPWWGRRRCLPAGRSEAWWSGQALESPNC